MRIPSVSVPLACVASILGVCVLAGCEDKGEPPPKAYTAVSLQSVVVRPERTPVERVLNGTIDAVNEGTVAAQTSGRVEAIPYDVNDLVPAGSVIVRLRATEQRVGLLQAQAALQEATAREAQAQTQYRRISDMYDRKVVPKRHLPDSQTFASSLTMTHECIA